jgi:hypothetical protein
MNTPLEPWWFLELVTHDVGRLKLEYDNDYPYYPHDVKVPDYDLVNWESPEMVQTLTSVTSNHLEMIVDCSGQSDIQGIARLLARNEGPSDLDLRAVEEVRPDDFQRLAQGLAVNRGRLHSFEAHGVTPPLFEAFLAGFQCIVPPQLHFLSLDPDECFMMEPLTDTMFTNLLKFSMQCPCLETCAFSVMLQSSSNITQLFLGTIVASLNQARVNKRLSVNVEFPRQLELRSQQRGMKLSCTSTDGMISDLFLQNLPTFELAVFLDLFQTHKLEKLEHLYLCLQKIGGPIKRKVVNILLDNISGLSSLQSLDVVLWLEPDSGIKFCLEMCLLLAQRSTCLSQLDFFGYCSPQNNIGFRMSSHGPVLGLNSESADIEYLIKSIRSCLLVNSYWEKAKSVQQAPYRASLLGHILANCTSCDVAYLFAHQNYNVLPRNQIDNVLPRKRLSITGPD